MSISLGSMWGFFRKDPTNASLQKAMRCVLFLAQVFALMPVYGIFCKDVNKIYFKWASLKVLYCFANISGSFGLAVMNFVRFLKTGMHFGDLVSVIFYASSILASVFFVKISCNWSVLSKKWFETERNMHKYEYQPNLKRRFMITTTIVMFLALGEHLLFVSKIAVLTLNCPLIRSNPVKAYFGAAFAQIFTETEYALWKAVLMEILNILATFVWNFMDLFVMLMSMALAEKFRQINKRVQKTNVKNDAFWKEIREDYNALSLLCDDLDDTITDLVTLSFANNLFFICVQLFNSLQPIDGFINTIYFFCSFGFLFGRTAAVSMYASWINDESRVLLPILFEVPSEDYGIEAARLVQQMNTSPIAISVSKYFYLTRSLCLTVAGAIITFELILQQISPFLLRKKDDNADDTEEIVFCVK